MDVFIDFETRSAIDLKKVGAYVYGAHPSTTLLCLAFAVGNNAPTVWQPGDPFPGSLSKLIRETVAGESIRWNAHNAAFERIIWKHVLARKFSLPDIPLKSWVCTAARCAAAGLPRSLGGASLALGLTRSKDTEGRALMLKYTKPKPGKPGEFHDDPNDLKRIARYCATDVVVERDVHHATPDMPESELCCWWLDQLINDRGIPIDIEFAKSCVRQLAQYKTRLDAELSEVTGGEVTAASQTAKLTQWVKDRAPYGIAGLAAEFVREYLARPETPPDVRRALEIRAELSKTSTAKYEAIVSQAGPDNRVRGAHLYWGGHTGRWAGRGVQTQNLPRGAVTTPEIDPLINLVRRDHGLRATELIYDNPLDALSSLIRPTIQAHPGKTLIPCDFAAIEARGLAWLVGERGLLQAFREGADVYKRIASRIYAIPETGVTKPQRQLGKIAILGLGYGMGASKFVDACAGYRVEIDEDFSKQVVEIYRESNPAIVAYWRALNAAAMGCVASGQPKHANKVRFAMETVKRNRWLRCWLPSGRAISYFEPQLKAVRAPWGETITQLHYWSENSVTHRWEITSTYGGKLAENVTQGVCRDLLAEAMFRLERNGYPVVLHVHDEAVPEVEDTPGLEAGPVERLMSVRPTWGRDFPIAAAGFVSRRYRKD